MLRNLSGISAIVICLGASLAGVASRAEDFQPSLGSSFSPVDPQTAAQAAEAARAAEPSTTARNTGAAHYTIAPWAEPPHDSSVAPRPQRTQRAPQSSYSYWGRQPKTAVETNDSQASAPVAPPSKAAASRPRQNVRLAAHADEPPPELPAPSGRSSPAPMGSSVMGTSPVGSTVTGPTTHMPMGSSEIAGPVAPCDCHGYWIPDSDFPVPGRWFFGSESLVVRPHQTRDTAFESSPNGGTGAETTNVNFNAGYEAAFRVFAGCDLDCDRSLRFTYTYIFDDSKRSADVADGSVILSPIGASLNPGDSINAIQHLLLQTWDIDNVHQIELPGCGSGCCSCWQATWSAGVRIIDLEETILNEVNGLEPGTFNQKSAFVGAGPRVGFEVRRPVRQSRLMAFAGADAALLLGSLTTTGSDVPAGTSSAQIVPDFDIRIGLCWQPRPEMSITTGWMFEIFGDALSLNQDATTATLVRPQASSLSYDGLFVRGEFHF